MEDALYKCPRCEVVKTLRGLSCHVTKTHRMSSRDLHVAVLHNGTPPLCACGCGKETNWLQRRFGTYASRGCNGFSNDARAKALEVRAEKSSRGEQSSWNAGLTKETDKRVAAIALKISEAMNGADISRLLAARSDEEKETQRVRMSKAKAGSVPWNVGLTKETSASLTSVSRKNSQHARRRFNWKDKPTLIENAALVRSDQLTLIDHGAYENKHSSLLFECAKCNARLRRSLHVLRYSPSCPVCTGGDSKPQLEIFEYVRSISNDAMSSDKTCISPLELDVYVPSKDFAVEYNGLYWHCEKNKDRSYHQGKTNKALQNDIQLLHIYADDWEHKRPIVESMIRYRLNATSVKISARKCELVELIATERRQFLNECHLDGDVSAKTAFGLRFNGELVAVLSLRTPFHKTWRDHIEVARFATKLNTSVAGGLSRLVKAASDWAKQRKYKGMLSYVDGRVGVGNGYIRAGFGVHGKTPPTFWWTDYKQRFNRFNYRADKERNMSEREVADEAGVVRIYGCENFVMVLNL